MELKKYRLGDIAEIIGGVSYSPKDICTGGIRILRGGNIQNQHIELKTDDVFLPISYKNNISQIYVGDTILVASTGSVDVLGKAATCFQYTEDVQIGAFLRIIRPKADKYTMLISSALSSDYFKRYIKAQAKGTSINNITLGYLRDFEIYAPHDFTGLSHLSANIENKICLNRAINDNLEAMAKQLYDYWFVQFDFPNEEGKPYKSSGGAMVWNEKLKREIPSSFEVVNMGKLCDFRNGINYSKDETGNDYQIVNVRNISSSRILLDGEDFDVITVPTSKAGNYVLKPDDIIIARSGCPGSTRLLLSPANTLFCGFIICCSPNDSRMRNYLVYCLKQLEGTNATTSGGSILQNVSQDTLKGLHVIVPEKQIIDKFNKTIELIFARMLNCLKESKALTKQRNELLPLLMNGQATVNSD